ncbi:Mg chelatase-related protein [Corynebacterium mustelae]|uniref:Mg chelatase-related protein n=2 Tax=Corynebacterium mustelae TaxID=571915 RepID=A0A0G3GYK0_9CORY|nr:Mg chelatase-related protein [Corynebacterium mustelae]
MLAKTLSMTLTGVTAEIVEVEANVGAGLPGTHIVGKAATGVIEARDRIKTAAINSGLPWPKTKVIVSLLPGNLAKTGSHFDAAIAVAILSTTRSCSWNFHMLANTMILGEVALDGTLRAVPGVLPALLAAERSQIETVIVPAVNSPEAVIATGVKVLVAQSLTEIMEWLSNDSALATPQQWCAQHQQQSVSHVVSSMKDMNQIAGQPEAKFAAEVAAAGGHNVFFIGPGGSGKSMIAERIPTLLPQLTTRETIESTVVHSIAGRIDNSVVTTAPFIAPHHSVTTAGLLGGGAGNPLPGAVSLAHNGVLFLDEVSEIPARVLDQLRMPMEDGVVRLQRSHQTFVFPARFQLVLAANPCRCGAETPTECTCSGAVRARYLDNLSGPLRDRIDIFVRTYSKGPLQGDADTDSSAVIAMRVAEARNRARHRWDSAGLGAITNAAVESAMLRRHFPADDAGMAIMESYLAHGDITQRGVDRALKLAWTLADLDRVVSPTLDHVARALELREDVAL